MASTRRREARQIRFRGGLRNTRSTLFDRVQGYSVLVHIIKGLNSGRGTITLTKHKAGREPMRRPDYLLIPYKLQRCRNHPLQVCYELTLLTRKVTVISRSHRTWPTIGKRGKVLYTLSTSVSTCTNKGGFVIAQPYRDNPPPSLEQLHLRKMRSNRQLF